jgi:molecular chaperone DnaK
MDNQNIQIGIDLGTTNSEIAINNNGSIEIIKNIFGSEYTPSVFGFDKSRNIIVGKKAYEKLYKETSEDDIKNCRAEVKRIIGTPEKVYFPRVDRYLTPEEISSEILKTLKEDVLRKYPQFPANAAVITTPASFDTTQAEATKRAGNLAGFSHVVLLQEPIAAAIAYGYMNLRDENLLVYDFGGGTFDVALIASAQGTLTVLGHNGDNFLGGKDFDKLIMHEILVTEILKRYSIAQFAEKNAKFRTVFAKLKYLAENAKIDLSQYPKTTIDIEGIGKDDVGREILLAVDITRERFEQLIKPLIDKTIILAQKTIKEAGINPASVNKILLVGGPTQIPYIRERLKNDLKISLDTSADPLTVVARGASIFAIGQQIPGNLRSSGSTKKPDAKEIELHFSSLTAETEETITGNVPDLNNNSQEHFIQIQSDSGHYTSARMPLKRGKFFDTITLIPNRTNIFWIYIFDAQGNPVPTYPDSFSITNGLSVGGAPIPHAIGVSVAKKDIRNSGVMTEIFEPFFEKGNTLPLTSEPRKYRTVKTLRKGEDNNLPIKVYEGESEIPDRNTFVCDVKIKGTELPYDLPENTDVELILKVDESRVVDLEVYIPTIDRTFSARGSILAENIDFREVEREFKTEIERAAKVEEDCSIDERASLHQTVASIEKSLRNAPSDEDENRKASKQLKDLKVQLDKLEKEKELPQLIKIFHERANEVELMVKEIGQEQDRKRDLDQLHELKTEGERAIGAEDKFLLIRVNEQLLDLARRVYFSHPAAWVHQYNQILERNKTFTNPKEAQYYIEKGRKCIDSGDAEGLRQCVLNLLHLLPLEEQAVIRNTISGITH